MQISFPSYYGLYFMGAIAVIIFFIYIFAGREAFSKRNPSEESTIWQGDLPEKVSSGKQGYQLQEPGIVSSKTIDFEAMKLKIMNADGDQGHLEETKIPAADASAEPPVLGVLNDMAENLEETKVLSVDILAEKTSFFGAEALHETIVMSKADFNGSESYETISKATLPNGTEAQVFDEDDPQPFGFKMCWLAVADADQFQVIRSLGLTNVRECGWRQGMSAAYGEAGPHDVFVTPPVNNWILVIGRALWNKMDLNGCLEDNLWYQHLLSQHGEVHYYSTHRAVGNHAWVKGKKGHIVRGYGYSGELGEIMWCVGDPTPQEQWLRFNFYTPDNVGSKKPNLRYPDEQDVLILAALWSVDTTFENSKIGEGPGYIGSLPE